MCRRPKVAGAVTDVRHHKRVNFAYLRMKYKPPVIEGEPPKNWQAKPLVDLEGPRK